jgi:excinuclease UvrABC nuclease subunit
MAIEKIKEKSGILTWTEENIKNAPASPGVFILRTSPINGAVLYVAFSNDLKSDLLKVLLENTFPDTKFFDWYTTNTKEEAELIKRELDMKYGES